MPKGDDESIRRPSLERKEEAEATLAEANVELAKANTRVAEATARKGEAEAEEAELKLDGVKRREREELAADKHNHVYIFNGTISDSTVSSCINQLTLWHRTDATCAIEIIFNSPGGDIIGGMALFDFIRMLRTSHEITTTALGMAASMAGILLQAGTRRVMGKEAWLLIHETSFAAGGKTGEVEDHTEWVKKIQKRILKIFSERSSLSERQLNNRWQRKDWWIDSDEALQYNLIDEIR